jgi:hypothetical protein
MDSLNPLLVDAHAAEMRERMLASVKPRRSPRHRSSSSPWALWRRVGHVVVAGRWVASRRQGDRGRRAHGRGLEA